MLLLNRNDIRKVATMRDMIESVKLAFLAVSEGTVDVPLRTVINGNHDGSFLFMPAYSPSLDAAALKVIDIFPHNVDKGLMTSPAQTMLIDGSTGYVCSMLDGTYVTQLRTGASTGAAFDLLAKKDCRKGALIGTGGQAPAQLEAMLESRKPGTVHIYDTNKARCLSFVKQMQAELASYGSELVCADSSDECITDADLIVTVTPSAVPVFNGDLVKKGCTISAVGTYEPHKHELPSSIIARADRIICDSKSAALAETGDLLIPIAEGIITEGDISGSLGEVISSKVPGRTNDDEIIVYETVGVAAQDLFAAKLIYDKAVSLGIGTLWE